jgi:serine phosphatase RsbU (regulator of sigma subunit)/drug/metabolite transporter (DMT)-like permease
MKKIYRNGLIAFLFVICHFVSHAQSDSSKKGDSDKDTTRNVNVNLSDFASDDPAERHKADSVMQLINDEDNLIDFKKYKWKIKAGDDSTWSFAAFDDSKWKELTDTAKLKSGRDSGSISWYRVHFQVDSSLTGIPLAFSIRQFGSAADVYLDGKFLKSFGRVGKDLKSEIAELNIITKPLPFSFSPQKDHVFALRISNFHSASPKKNKINIHVNFQVSVNHLEEKINDITDTSDYFPFIFFAAIFLTLGFFHLILYIFNRQKRTNLVYSIYCFGVFGFSYCIYFILTATEFEGVTSALMLLAYAVPFIFVVLVGMLHRIFYGKRLKIFWVFPVMLAAAILCLVKGNIKAGAIVVTILFMAAAIEILRVIFQAIRKKKDGAWIFAMVILLAPIAGIISSNLPDEFSVGGLKIPNNTGAIVGSCFILGLPFAMTLYLARDFSRMAKQLKKQLTEITDLSEKTIHQEKEKKQILENQNIELEKKVTERTSEVVQQKEVIEIKNKEITDNLTYAKRIQSAILPDVRLIYKTLEQSFILYLPKDIVSGDFYGFAQKDNRVLIAAADCTGHGVAGAFMSMIGSALLNQIINEKNITRPSIILDELNDGIIHSLKQKESDSNDGMDISICSFDLEGKTMEFAGANRPLWLIRDNQLLVFKPNKFPIGGLQILHDEKFKQHEIELQNNDVVYIFSDGYSDQFGGEKGKKLMSKKFKELLLSIQNLSMHDQEKYLHDHFQKWKMNNEQVDDVLVIGIRI